MQYDIEHADILEWAARYDGPLYHAAFMDAPYEEEFMGKGWDNSGIAFNVETWKAIARHLHPGAFLFVFAGTLNDDLISVAMRNAGLRKYHRSGAWIYGSGFPKSAKLDTVIDRRAGVERTKIGTRKHQPKFDAAGHGYRQKDNGFNSKDRTTFDVTKPATELAETWQPYRYGGQMLKPALESLLIFQKPVIGDMVTSITTTGAGALWVDGARIGSEEMIPRNNMPGQNGAFNASGGTGNGGVGRWPANFSLSHHPDCEQVGVRRVRVNGPTPASVGLGRSGNHTNGIYGAKASKITTAYADADGCETVANWHCVSSCPVKRLGEQSGESTKREEINNRHEHYEGVHDGYGKTGMFANKIPGQVRNYAETGTAARFFHQADYVAERIEASDPVGYYAKASRSEREAGLDDMQARIMRDLYGTDETFEDDTIDDGRATPIDNPYQRGKTERKNIHPTIKPIALNRWISTLLLPPDLYAPRRLLIPFAGAGSEMIGAMLAGWEHVQGIELEETHVAIARARIAFWQQMRYKLMNPDAPVKVTSAAPVPDGQATLW